MALKYARSIAILFGLFLAALVWTWWAGKDLNWDQINYHIYGVDLMLKNRWQQDYYAASVQSYLNPISYVPFYAMVMANWNDFIISAILAAIHFICIIAVWYLYPRIVTPAQLNSTALRTLACALAFISPLFLLALGSSFNDPLCAIMVILGILAVIGFERPNAGQLLCAGFLLGAAAGIKLTSGTFAIAGFSIVILSQNNANLKRLSSALVTYAVGCALGFLTLHGAWSWRLWHEFRNPFFPFFNGIFRAPDFLPANLHDTRFLGDGIAGLLTLPWRMMLPYSWVYAEAATPDIRFFAFILAMGIGLGCLVWRYKIGNALAGPPRGLYQLTIFFIASFFIWGLTSRIGRYAMPLWILLGPLLVGWMIYFWPQRRQLTLTLLLLIFGVQIAISEASGLNRWTPVKYSGDWFKLDIPASIGQRPGTFVTISSQSMAFLAPFLHSDSSLINLSGQYTLPAGNRMSERLKSLLGKNDVVYLVMNSASPSVSNAMLQRRSEQLSVYGLQIKASDTCSVGSLGFDRKDYETTDNPKDRAIFLLFCPLHHLSLQEANKRAEKGRALDGLFETMEKSCPKQFDPPGVETMSTAQTLGRTYFNSTTTLFVERGALYSGGYGVLAPTFISTLEDIKSGGAINCPPPIKYRYLK